MLADEPQLFFRWAGQDALMSSDGAVLRTSSDGCKEPSVYRPLREGRLQVRFVGCPDSRAWIKDICGSRTRPEWSSERRGWLVARAHLYAIVNGLLVRFELPVHVFVEFRANEHCGQKCQGALDGECTCPCLGVHHGTAVSGGSRSGWVQVGAATMIHHGEGIRRHLVAYPGLSPSLNGITRR
jgi:hypothetical protein